MKIGNTISKWLVAGALVAAPVVAASSSTSENSDLDRDVRKAINTLAWYDVFDNLTYSIAPDGAVTVAREVMQYNVRNSAIAAVKALPGVVRVIDNIEVLPLSPYDNNIRIRAYNAIFGLPSLNRYALNARPPIRIIVKNGNVTLTGVVNNAMDRTLAYNRVQALPGVFSVSNELRLDSDSPAS